MLDEDGEWIGHCPRKYVFDAREVDCKAELEIFVNKPRAVKQGVCLKVFPSVLKEFILCEDIRKRPRRIRI